jgi:hypothetical protein
METGDTMETHGDSWRFDGDSVKTGDTMETRRDSVEIGGD